MLIEKNQKDVLQPLWCRIDLITIRIVEASIKDEVQHLYRNVQ